MANFLHIVDLVSVAVLIICFFAILYMLRRYLPAALRMINRWLHTFILFLSEIALGAMVLIVILAVTLRQFNSGLAWAEEVPRLMVGYFAFFACAMGVRDKKHISVDILYNLAPKNGWIRKGMEFLANLCVLACGAFMLISGSERITQMMRLSGKMPITQLPNWVRYIAVPVVGFIIVFDSLLYIFRILRPGDLLFSEPETDYAAQVMHESKGGEK